MKKYLTVFSALMLTIVLNAQQTEISQSKKKPLFDVAVGISWSAIDFSVYSQHKVAKSGADLKAILNISNSFKMSAEYTFHFLHNDNPSWYNIHASNIDINAHASGNIINSKIGFYTIFGASLLNWRGNFTGYRNERHDGVLRTHDEELRYAKLMINLGMGIERSFKYFSLFFEGKFRFAKEPEIINVVINDVFYCFGVKSPVMLPSSKKKDHSKIPGDRYHWF